MKKYDSFRANLRVLHTAAGEDLTNEFIVSGIIDKFFLQFELSWKLLKEILKYEGEAVAATGSPREILKAAYRLFDFIDEGLWLKMLKERNSMAHLYDGARARALAGEIITVYEPAFCRLQEALRVRYGDKLPEF